MFVLLSFFLLKGEGIKRLWRLGKLEERFLKFSKKNTTGKEVLGQT